jgi:hypothetical protein
MSDTTPTPIMSTMATMSTMTTPTPTPKLLCGGWCSKHTPNSLRAITYYEDFASFSGVTPCYCTCERCVTQEELTAALLETAHKNWCEFNAEQAAAASVSASESS